MNMKQVSIESLGLSSAYEQVAKSYFEDIKEIYGEDLLLFMITSSCSIGECIEGWSDIDVLIVTKTLNFVKLKMAHDRAVTYPIKIALAALSEHEARNGIVDSKTRVVLYQISTGIANTNFVNGASFPETSLDDVRITDNQVLPYYLHRLRRLLYAPSDDKRTIIKYLYLVSKILLRRRENGEIWATSYVEAYEKISALYKIEPIDISAEMMTNGPASDAFVLFARTLVEKICNG